MKGLVKRKDYCQFLLASQVNYTLTYFVDHARGFSHDAATRYLRVTGLGLLNYGGRTLTTPSQPTQAISSGLETLLANAGLSLGNLKNATIIHGTTLITNALITRSGKSPALITTKGAGDSIETGKGNPYDPYDRMLERPAPLAPRQLRKMLSERVLADGTVYVALDETEVRNVFLELLEAGVEAVAVCLLNSYATLTPATSSVLKPSPKKWA